MSKNNNSNLKHAKLKCLISNMRFCRHITVIYVSYFLIQLDSVDSILVGMARDSLPIAQWSQLGVYATSNATATVVYLQTMSALYSAQFTATENMASLISGNTMSVSIRSYTDFNDTLTMSTRGSILMVVAMVSLLFVLAFLILLEHSRTRHFEAVSLELEEQRNAAENARSVAEKALCAKDRFLTNVSV